MTRAPRHTCSSTATSHARARTWAGCCAASERYSRSARAGAARHANTPRCVLAAAATAPHTRVGGCNLTMHASQAATPLCCTQARPPGRGHEALAERPPCGRAAHVARVLERYGTRRAPVTRRARGCNPVCQRLQPCVPEAATRCTQAATLCCPGLRRASRRHVPQHESAAAAAMAPRHAALRRASQDDAARGPAPPAAAAACRRRHV